MNILSEYRPKIKLPFFAAGVFALTFIAILLRTLNLFFFYDIEIGYFSSGAALPVVMNVFAVIAIFGIAAASFFVSKETYAATGCEKNLLVKISSAICVLGFLFPIYIVVKNVLSIPALTLPTHTLIFLVVFFIAAVYFATNLTSRSYKYHAILAISVILSAAYFLANSYFDLYVPMNAPNKVLLHLACISVMIFMSCEARCMINEAKKRFYVCALSLAVFLSGFSSIPAVITALSNKLSYNYFVFDCVILTVFLYLSARLISLVITKERVTEEISDEATSNISDSADESTDCNIVTDDDTDSAPEASDNTTQMNDQ